METQDKVFVFGCFLMLVGSTLVVTTVHQVKVGEPDFPEDYHMGLTPNGKYEWRSHNTTITYTGVILIGIGICCILYSLFLLGQEEEELDKT